MLSSHVPAKGQSAYLKYDLFKEKTDDLSRDTKGVRRDMDELQQELYTLGASVYQQEGAQAGGAAPGADAGANGNGASPGATGGGASDDVIDAEFTETK